MPHEKALADSTRAQLERASMSAARILHEASPLSLEECIGLAEELAAAASAKG